ncbi:MAG: hypothetical protein ACPHRO_10380 [Nannocystaceae bacterium]
MDTSDTSPPDVSTQPAAAPDNEAHEDLSITRGALLLATLRFNLKLALEGAKDIFLAPLSLAAAVLGMILPSKHAAVPLKFVLRTGHRFDEAIDLYTLKELKATDTRALPPADTATAEGAHSRGLSEP